MTKKNCAKNKEFLSTQQKQRNNMMRNVMMTVLSILRDGGAKERDVSLFVHIMRFSVSVNVSWPSTVLRSACVHASTSLREKYIFFSLSLTYKALDATVREKEEERWRRWRRG
jgi:hypothetical protein